MNVKGCLRLNTAGEMMRPGASGDCRIELGVIGIDSRVTVGNHLYCDGGIGARQINAAGDYVLHCRGCGLRVQIPARVKTFADLRTHLETTYGRITDKVAVGS